MAAPQVPPGPGSDVDMDDASDVSSDSFISDLPEDTTSSAETSDSDEGVDWSQVGPSFITTRAALDALGEKRPIPQPPPPPAGSAAAAAAPNPSPVRPPPQRIPLNGLKTFVQWIPYWCDPEWNDEHWKFEKDGQPTEWVEVHPLDKQRPALLAKDSLKNPTPWAKRFGIHADQLDGRSRMSPPLSDTRHVHLSYPVQTYTGMKEEITIEDVKDFLRKHPNNFATEEEYIRSIDQTANSELVYAYLQLQDLIEEDEIWQRAALGDTTTEERIATDSHSLDPSPVTYDLDGPLHPLVRRERWMNQLDRGDVEDSPRLLYNLQGNRGEWTAHDENVWIAIQPALQVITRILNTKHPYWVALVHAESRREINSSQLLFGLTAALSDNWTSFTTHYNPNSWPPDQLGAQYLNVLQQHGYDLPSAIGRFLKQRLRLCFASVAVDWKKGAPVGTVHWGSCCPVEEDDPSSVGIQINIGAEIVWPLLAPDFTDKEKACCSMMLVSTVLHELAHACISGLSSFLYQSTLPIVLHGPPSHLYNLHPDVMGALQGLHREINSRREPYFEDEPITECGFAFENVLFGGTLDTGFGHAALLYAHYNTFSLSLTLVTKIFTLLPRDTYTRFFSQSFWNSDLQKYGFEALKMHAGTNALTILGRAYQRKKDLRRVFGKSHAQWLCLALDYLLKLGHPLLYAYCRNLLEESMESIWVRKRFHHECKVWPRQTKIFDGIVDMVHRRMAAVSVALQDANSPIHAKVQSIDVENEQNRQAYLRGEIAQQPPILDMNGYCGRLYDVLCKHFISLVRAYLEMHHYLLQEIRSLQTLVVDYVEQPQNARQRLYDHYISLLYKKIEETYEPVVVESIKVLDEVQKQSISGNFLTQQLDDEIQRIRNYFQLDLNHLSKTKFYMTEDNILVQKFLWVGDLESIPAGRKRKRSDDLKRMAMKDLFRVKPEIRKLVETYAGILKVNIADDGKDDERQQNSLSLLRINERIQKDLKANPTRQAMAAGPPGWLNPTPARTPVQTGFQPPPQRSVQPWQAAPTSAPSAADRGVLFGQSSELTPVATPPSGTRTPVSGGGFGQYAAVDTSALFPRADPQAQSVFHNPNPDLVNMPLYNLLVPHEAFGGQPAPPPAPGPFGTAWSDSRTVSEELHRQGVATPEFQGVWGRDVYLRRKAAEDAARLAAEQSEQARQQARQHVGQVAAHHAAELTQRLAQTLGRPPFP